MASLVRTHHLSTHHRPYPPPSPPPSSSVHPYYYPSHSHSHDLHLQQRQSRQEQRQEQHRREMQSIPAYHDPRGHISPMATRRIGRNEFSRTSSNNNSSSSSDEQGTIMETGFGSNSNNTAATHGLQFTVPSTATRGPFDVNHSTPTNGQHMYTLDGTRGTSTTTAEGSYDFVDNVSNGGSRMMSAIPDPNIANNSPTSSSSSSSNKIRIPASAIRALSLPTHSRQLPSHSNSGQQGVQLSTLTGGSPTDTCNNNNNNNNINNNNSSSSSGCSGGCSRDRGVIRTALPSTNGSSGGGSQGKRKSSPGKAAQQLPQQQQPKDRQSFHATLVDLFTRDKKALLCPKCHQEGNIHRDGISEGKMRFTCNTMVPAAPIGKRRKCNKHFYERAMHTMLIEIVRKQQQQEHGRNLAVAVAVGIPTATVGEMSDLEGGFCTDMSSASPEMAPWHHPLLTGGSAF